MIIYFFFLILTFLPLIEGEFLGIGQFVLLAFCLPLSIYLYKKKIVLDKINLLFFLFLLIATLSTIFSPVSARSLQKLILYLAYFIYFLSTQRLARENKKVFKKLLIISIFLPSFFLSLLSFYFLLTSQPPPFSTMNLLYANFGHSHIVDFLVFAFPLSIGSLFFPLFLVTFIFSFSRGGIIIALLAILLFQFFSKKLKKNIGTNKPTTAYLLNVSCLALIFSLIFATLGYYYLGEQKIKYFDSFILNKTFRQPPFEIRWEYWRQALAAFFKRPILGWGLDNFRYASKMFQKCPSCWSWHTHNHFLQMFAETGFLGGGVFLVLIYLIIKKIRPSEKSDTKKICLEIGVLTSILYSFFDYGWQFSAVFLFFWVIVGYLISQNRQKKAEREINKMIILGAGIMLFVVASLQLAANLYLFAAARQGEKKELKKAAAYYQKSLKIWPFKLENWWSLIRFYEENGQFDQAINYLKRLLKLEPLNISIGQELGDIYLKQNQKVLAVQNYYQLYQIIPSDFQIAFKLIELENQEANLLNVDQVYSILEQIEKHNRKDCVLKCLEFENEKKIEQLLLQLIKQDRFSQLNQKQQARVYFWLAVLTTYQEDWDKDIAYLQKATDLDATAEYQEFLSDTLWIKEIQQNYWQDDFDKVKQLTQGIDTKTDDHFFHQKFYLARIYVLLSEISDKEGNIQQKDEYYHRALEINPWLEQ